MIGLFLFFRAAASVTLTASMWVCSWRIILQCVRHRQEVGCVQETVQWKGPSGSPCSSFSHPLPVVVAGPVQPPTCFSASAADLRDISTDITSKQRSSCFDFLPWSCCPVIFAVCYSHVLHKVCSLFDS